MKIYGIFNLYIVLYIIIYKFDIYDRNVNGSYLIFNVYLLK